jgi:hypothetical protein
MGKHSQPEKKSLVAHRQPGSRGTADLKNTYTFDGLKRMTRVDQQGQTGGNTVAEKPACASYLRS